MSLSDVTYDEREKYGFKTKQEVTPRHSYDKIGTMRLPADTHQGKRQAQSTRANVQGLQASQP